MTLEPERDNPNDIRTKLAQHVQVAHKMAALSSDWSAPYAPSNAEYNILRRKFFVRGDTEHALHLNVNVICFILPLYLSIYSLIELRFNLPVIYILILIINTHIASFN